MGKAYHMLYRASKVYDSWKFLVPPYYNQTGPILEVLY